MSNPERKPRQHSSKPTPAPRLNKSFNQEYDQYYGRRDWTNTNQNFSTDHDNNYEPNSGFTSNTNPSTGSNYNQQGFEHDSELALSSHYGKGPKGFKRSDESIKEEVSEVLYTHPGVDASEIEVVVHEGIVSLSGSVISRKMKRTAEGVIEFLPGVKDVMNMLKIS